MNSALFNHEAVFNNKKPAIKLILETPTSKEIRILLQKGQLMKEHKTPYPIVIHIISGTIDFEVEGTTHQLETGAILGLNGNVPHSLLAKQDSIIRLSLAKQDTVLRVEKVVN